MEGRGFTIFTDHRPILAALNKTSEPASGRQARQLAAIAEATTDIRHVSGKDNVVADVLSRVEPLPAAVKPTFSQVYLDNPEDSPDEAPGFLCNAIQQGIDYRE